MKLFFLLFILNSTCFAETFFTARVDIFPGGSFKLEGKEIRGKIVKSGDGFTAEKLKINVKKLDAGVSLRSYHLHKLLTDKKNRYIKITNAKASGGSGTAMMKIKNVEKQIEFKYKDIGKNHLTLMFSIELHHL